jgi:hypothetical protein
VAAAVPRVDPLVARSVALVRAVWPEVHPVLAGPMLAA